MCIGSPSAPKPPPLPPPPPPPPEQVSESVRSSRNMDKERRRVAANATNGGNRVGASSAAGLLTPANVANAQGTLIGG